MSNLITLTCPSCGGRLEVTNNTEQYRCLHCGNAHLVEPGVRAESLANEIEILKYEDQIRKVEAKLENLMEQQRQAWQSYGAAEEDLAKQRSKKQSGLIYGGLGLGIILLGWASNSPVSGFGIIFILLGVVAYFAANDSEAQSTQAAAIQQVEDTRNAIRQKQSELAQLRTEQTNKRLQSAARSTLPSR